MRRAIIYLGVVHLLLASALSAQEDRNVLIVSGVGEAWVEPDMATITLGVSTLDFSAEEAYQENNSKMRGVIDALKQLGVESSDIKTTRFAINPSYDYDPNTRRRTFNGYQVTHGVTVHVRDLKVIGRLLDEIVKAGVTDVSGISFGVQEPQESETSARERAVNDAHRKATGLAQAAGVGLGSPIRIDETGHMPTPLFRAVEAGEAAPIEPGMYRVVVTVTIHYVIE